MLEEMNVTTNIISPTIYYPTNAHNVKT